MHNVASLTAQLTHKRESRLVDLSRAKASAAGKDHRSDVLGNTERTSCLCLIYPSKIRADGIAHAHHLCFCLEIIGGGLKIRHYHVHLVFELLHRHTRDSVRFVNHRRHTHRGRRLKQGPANVSARTDNDIGLKFFDYLPRVRG